MTDLPRGLVVSLTPSTETPWRSPDDVARLAVAVAEGGAGAIKVDGAAAVTAVRRVLPGIHLTAVALDYDREPGLWITRTADEAARLHDAGCDLVEVGFDPARRLALGEPAQNFVARLVAAGMTVKANVASVAEVLDAQAAGAAVIGSSSAGYPAPSDARLPDVGLVADLVAAADLPVVAERGYSTAAQIDDVMRAGAHAVVVGSAIADPVWLTRRFVAWVKEASGHTAVESLGTSLSHQPSRR